VRLRRFLTASLIAACVAMASHAHADLLAYYDLNGITNAQISDLQYQTNNQLVFGATLTNWTKSGFNAVHAIQLSGTTPGGPGNYVIMIFGDNLITQQTAFPANDAGKTYYASYDIGPTVYANPGQATQAGDQLRINLLRNDDSILASSVVAPGAWQGVQTFSQAYFSYVGDGLAHYGCRCEASSRVTVDSRELWTTWPSGTRPQCPNPPPTPWPSPVWPAVAIS